MNDYVLFDLDGTLTDPKIGITTCVQYALKHFGIEEPNLDKLEPFIGPPLKESFMEFYGFDEKQGEEATQKYRERFQDTGIFENKIYGGIKNLLKQCKKNGAVLGVASSKPEVFVKRILEHFQIAQYFDVVVGSELDGRRTDKGEVIQEALRRLFKENDIEYDKVVMVGDRKFDINGARQNGIVSIGVSYGYGDIEELKEAKADFIARTVDELRELLLRGRGKGEEKTVSSPKPEETLTKKILNLAFPLAFYYLLTDALRLVLNYLILTIITSLPSDVALGFVVMAPNSPQVLGFRGDVTAFINGLSFLAAFIVVYKTMGKMELIQARFIYDIKNKGKKIQQSKNQFLLQNGVLILCAMCISVGLNFLFNLIGMIQSSNEFNQIAQSQMAVSLPMGLLLYGLLSPLAEEMLFRGVMFNRIKKYLGTTSGILLSGVLFGMYHGNWVQGIYGAMIGCILAWIYDRSGEFGGTVLFHGVVNVTAFLLTYLNVFQTAVYGFTASVILLILGVVLLWVYRYCLLRRK